MSDLRKLLDIINETTAGATSSGGVAPVAQSFHKVQTREADQAAQSKDTPQVLEYGNWENSALSTSNKLKQSRKKAAKIVKSIYGADSETPTESANPEQQAAIAMAKKKEKVKESIVTSKSILAEDQDNPVLGAIIRRIMLRHPDLLAHGPERVMQAAEEVANNTYIDPDGEIGTSDVSAWVNSVRDILSMNETEKHGDKEWWDLIDEGVKTEVDEANAFTDARMNAIKAGKDTFQVGGKTYKVTGDTGDEREAAGITEKQGVAEGSLEESDLIINPAGITKLVRGFVPHEHDRTDHEVEMARSDLYQASKNAKQIFDCIRDLDEEQGLEGWVQEKITKAADYLNTVREYLESKQLESMDGVSPGTRMFASESAMKCSECGGLAYGDEKLAEAQDACYNKVKSRYKVWPSAYASGALVKCRKVGAKNWGNKSKK